jgi:hypothetical protein
LPNDIRLCDDARQKSYRIAYDHNICSGVQKYCRFDQRGIIRDYNEPFARDWQQVFDEHCLSPKSIFERIYAAVLN